MERATSTQPGIRRREATIVRGRVRLAARITLPASTAAVSGGDSPVRAPCVVFVHGLGSSKESPRNVVIAERLVDAGIATVLFDLSGHGESSDDPRGGEAYVDDVAAACAWAREQPGIDAGHIGIAGSSMGATVAIEATVSGRVRPATLVLRAPPVGPTAFERLDVPALALIGSADPLLRDVREAAARGRTVTLSIVPGAGHLFEEPGTLEEALERTVAFFRERLLGRGAP